RTYSDKFVELINTNELPYHFRDEQAHASYAFTPTTKLSFTLYDGRDALDAYIPPFGDSHSLNPSRLLVIQHRGIRAAARSASAGGTPSAARRFRIRIPDRTARGFPDS